MSGWCLPSTSSVVGPRGDAFTADTAITADEAEEYHSEQLATLARADVDLVEAMTYNNALASMMGELARRHQHIDIWGGCCGTWDTHLDEIAQHVLASRETSV